MGRENMRKFEKFMSDKDRMLKQVKEDAEKDLKVNILTWGHDSLLETHKTTNKSFLQNQLKIGSLIGFWPKVNGSK